MSGPLFPVTLVPLGQYSSSAGTYTSVPMVHRHSPVGAVFSVKVDTAPSSSAYGSATLDVYVQHSADYLLAGPSSSNFTATWDDFAHIAHFDNASGARTSSVCSWLYATAQGSSINPRTAATATLGSGTVYNGPTGAAWRAQMVINGNVPSVPSSSAWKVGVFAQVVYP